MPEPIELYVITHHSATRAPAYVDIKRDLESAFRRAALDCGRPLAFEQLNPTVWQARSIAKRTYQVNRIER